jgi:hypothetical protein
MTKDGLLGLLCFIALIAELATNFEIPALNWASFMLVLTAILGGE